MNHAENHIICEILANVMLCNVQCTLLQLTHDIDAMRTFTKHTLNVRNVIYDQPNYEVQLITGQSCLIMSR